MNKLKIIIPVFLIIIIISVGMIITNSNEEVNEEIIEEIIEVQEVKWRYSGPFGIEKTEYNIGEKIFIDIVDIPKEDKGKAVVYRPLNATHCKEYLSIEFDGSKINNFNRYFEFKLNEWKGICSRNDLAGDWKIVFLGVEYEDLNFKVINQTSSWDTRVFEPLVGIGKC